MTAGLIVVAVALVWLLFHEFAWPLVEDPLAAEGVRSTLPAT